MRWHLLIVIVGCWCFQTSPFVSCKKEADDKSFLEEERKRLEPCSGVHDLNGAVQLRRIGKVEEALPCLVEQTRENMKAGWAWSNLGEAYRLLKDKANAKYAFKQAYRRDMGILSYIRRFDWVGPFPIGKTEVDGDPVVAQYGNVVSAWKNRSSAVFYSELIGGGRTLRWEEVDSQGDPAGTVQVQPNVDWNDLVNGVGAMALLEWQAWFVAEFAVNRDATYVVRCMGVSTVWINDKLINGDVYHRQQFWFSVPLTSGMHLFRLKLRTKAQAGIFRCEFSAQDANTMAIHHPHFVPELLSRHALNGLLAVPIFNRNDKKWLDPNSFRISVPTQSKEIPLHVTLPEDIEQRPIAPGQLSTLILQLKNKQDVGGDLNSCPPPVPGEADSFVYYAIRVATNGVGKTHETRLKMRCRNYTNSFLFTFLDHDGSVQHAAAVAPLQDCPPAGCPVMVTLHGTGVNPGNQADSYKRLEDGQMKYGLDTVWTLAPTRHGAHNWEGPGALTAMSALRALGELIDNNPWIPHKADTRRVVFAGHSMGGHGCWHLSTHFPDSALAVSTAAGWNTKEEYSDSNLFFKHDVSASFVDPSVKAVLEACITENEADRHVSNLKGVPVLARVGERDRTVHPYYLRRMRRALEASGVPVNYTEVAGKEHWWWDSKTPNDGGVTSDEEVRTFLNKATTPIPPAVCKSKSKKGCDPAASRYKRDHYLTEEMRAFGTFVLTCVNPAFQGSVRGVSVLQQLVPLRQSTIKITLQAGQATLVTANVLRLSLEEPSLAPVLWANKKVNIDGDDVSTFAQAVSTKKKLQLCRVSLSAKWSSCEDAENERLPASMGPARRVAEKPFLVVYGADGSAEDTAALQQAALYIANLFFLMSDTLAPVVESKKLSAKVAAKHNLIIVGGPEYNHFASEALSRVPLSAEKAQMKLESCAFNDPSSGAVVLSPHGKDQLSLVLLGNSLEGVLSAAEFASPTIPPMARSPFSNLVPDFIVTGPELHARGPAGYLCAGFWGNRWEYRRDLASCHC